MRKIVLLLSVIAAFCFSGPSMFANSVADGDPDTEIPIINGDGVGGTGGPINRAPAYVPIEAVYWAAASSIIVNFLDGLGTVVVAIENLSTGSYTQSVINARPGVYLFRISGEAGIYRISFTLSSGQRYTGMFELE